jgi:PAS domain S-box-containing protein
MPETPLPTVFDDGEAASEIAALARRARFLEANLAAIPDFVSAFNRQRRFAYANPAMLASFGLSADELLGKNFADLHYPPDLADLLTSHIDRVFADGVTVKDEVFYRNPKGQAAYLAYLWGPVRGDDGAIELVVGVSRDVSERRAVEEALRESEAQFRSFAAYSSNLIWIGDAAANTIIYRSAAYERIWGVPCREGPVALADWMNDVHPDDREQVEHALGTVKAGEVIRFEYRIVRPTDGGVRWLRDTSFPIPDDHGAVTRIGGIAEDLTPQDSRQAYVVSTKATQARHLVRLVREIGCRARTFDSPTAFLDIAPVLAPGCVLVDLRGLRGQGLSIPRELKARSIALPAILLDGPAPEVSLAVAAMKAGAIDFLTVANEESFRNTLANAIAECHGVARPSVRDESAASRVARLTSREREVLLGLVEGGTNKTIGHKLGISARTVELHRAHLMDRLNATGLTELLQIALAAGIKPGAGVSRKPAKND